MNKFAAFAVLAMAAFAISASGVPVGDIEDETMTQAILRTTDDEETAKLEDRNLTVFSDFCISSRDNVLTDLKSKSNDLTASTFSLFFSSAEAIGRESVETQARVAKKLANQLANPESPIDEPQDDIDEIVAEGQAKIQGENQPHGLFTAIKTNIVAVSQNLKSLIGERIQYIKSLATPEQFAAAISGGCDQITAYERQVRDEFELYKQTNFESDSEYAKLKLDNVPCATTAKIIRSEGLCGLVRVVQGPFKKILSSV